MIHQSGRATPGGSAALLCLITRPSPLVMTPSSSAHAVVGSTTSARSAVSERKKSDWAWNSSASYPRRTTLWCGRETNGLLQIPSSPRISPADIWWTISIIDVPLPGRSASSIPQTPAM